jgi:phosphohistidine phosphatase
MRVYLIRHGKARPKENDDERHLTDGGRAEVRKVAAFLKARKIHVGAIWHSNKTRAAETAHEISVVMKADQGLIERTDLAPNDAVAPVAREIMRQEADVAIVGHLPFLARLASRLVAGNESADVLALTTGSVACLEHDSECGWGVVWMISPELL